MLCESSVQRSSLPILDSGRSLTRIHRTSSTRRRPRSTVGCRECCADRPTTSVQHFSSNCNFFDNQRCWYLRRRVGGCPLETGPKRSRESVRGTATLSTGAGRCLRRAFERHRDLIRAARRCPFPLQGRQLRIPQGSGRQPRGLIRFSLWDGGRWRPPASSTGGASAAVQC